MISHLLAEAGSYCKHAKKKKTCVEFKFVTDEDGGSFWVNKHILGYDYSSVDMITSFKYHCEVSYSADVTKHRTAPSLQVSRVMLCM